MKKTQISCGQAENRTNVVKPGIMGKDGSDIASNTEDQTGNKNHLCVQYKLVVLHVRSVCVNALASMHASVLKETGSHLKSASA